MGKMNSMPGLAQRAVREQDPTRFSEILMSMLATRPQQLGQLVRDVLVKGPERADERSSARHARRAG